MKKKGVCSACNNETCGVKFTICRKCRNIRDHQDKREYARDWSLRKKYNLSLEEFEVYWMAFKGKCGICERVMRKPENRQGQAMDVVAVDHDHSTGRVRGLLCNACNKGLGMFNDNPIFLEKAKEWVTYGT